MNVIFYGNFGTSNWGNESTLLAIVSRLRAMDPDARLRCICSFPERAQARFGIDTVPFSTNTAPFWRRDVMLPRRMLIAIRRLVQELGQYVDAFRILKGTDMLVVPGTGLMTDAAGLHASGPYSLFKWALMARVRRTKVLLVSVGAGPIESIAGRLLFKAIMALATYASFRDEESLDCIREIGSSPKRERIYPDLVFSLPVPTLVAKESSATGEGSVVGLGLMVYWSRYSGGPDDTYTEYLATLATFAEWLLKQGHSIRLILGDEDTKAIADFRSVLHSRIGDDDERIQYQPFASVDDVLEAIAATDVVVATRFHNVVMAAIETKPVIALSFHHKCSELMRQMQLTEYCHDIHQIDAAQLIEQFQSLEQNRDAIRTTIAHGVKQAQASLDEQYAELFSVGNRQS